MKGLDANNDGNISLDEFCMFFSYMLPDDDDNLLFDLLVGRFHEEVDNVEHWQTG